MSEYDRIVGRRWSTMDNMARTDWLKEQVDKLTIAPAKEAYDVSSRSVEWNRVNDLANQTREKVKESACPPSTPIGSSGVNTYGMGQVSPMPVGPHIPWPSRSPEEVEKAARDWLGRAFSDFSLMPTNMNFSILKAAADAYQADWMAGRKRVTVSE